MSGGDRIVPDTILELRGICKDFGPVRVLFDIDLELAEGEVHAVLGENGAGKSTLMKVLSGYHQPSEGEIRLDGKAVTLADSGVGERLGIILIHQEFNLAEDLTVEENIFLGKERHQGPFLDRRAMVEKSREVLRELETRIDPRTRIRQLAVSEKQMVEIAKAVSRQARILIMDEPTAVLTGSETEILFRLIGRLKASGVTILYISHKLDEVKKISDRVTVLRDGKLITTRATAELSQDEMATLMVGRELKDMYPKKRDVGANEVVLAVDNLKVPGWVEGASFELRRGEVLGFAGLIGAGRTELMEGLLGLRPSQGTVRVRGREVRIRNLQDALKHRIVYLTEDRKGKGLITSMLLRPNLTLLSLDKHSRPFINQRSEQRALEGAVQDFDIRVPQLRTEASTLSGGNQQKLVLAKIMELEPEIIILDEPTRGIDVGTKRQIYYFIEELTSAGKSVMLISSEMQEIIGLANRVVVMRSGVITGTLSEGELEEQEIVRYAMGLKGAA
jgi:ribose transport system ATP-binding protein